ncbi:catalase/peroxidase HPI [Halomonas denitrificans]|nr:catalase/peroxidase HPI [Halomonas denitrificans]
MRNFTQSLAALAVAASLALPATNAAAEIVRDNQFWWPDQLDLSPLRDQDASSNPYDADFDYASEFATLDLDEVKADIRAVLTDSQDWWPADWGHYGPFFIRMAWHSAGTYRVIDGRGGAGGGQLRFDPQNSWPDNANLDKARRLLWPVKQKYGRKLSWADLMVLTGNVSMEDMGFETFGFAGGREDDWEPDFVYWGPEEAMLEAERRDDDGLLRGPVAATQMGLIYVNSAGPGGVPDPEAAAVAIRESFGRMAMDDEETLALIAGGHTFGKVHGARDPVDCVGPEPAAAGLEEQGLGWKNECGTGNGADTITSGHEGAWTQQPTRWTMLYLTNLLGFEWELSESPTGAPQWVAKDGALDGSVPEVQAGAGRTAPIMLTTDIALKRDPAYREIAERFLNNPDEFEDAFARAWFKLTHRDMGPRARYVGDEVPIEVLSWQDPVPAWDGDVVSDTQVAELKETILDSGLTVPELVRTAWASASTYRASDMRGGANGARIRLEPQIGWEVNDPDELTRVLGVLEDIQLDFNEGGGADISMADLIVLGGAAAIEKAAADAGHDVDVPFVPGRGDATQEMTEVDSFAWLEPHADAFRNYYSDEHYFAPLPAMVDKAALLDLTVPEMTALIGGLRALDANRAGAEHGVFTDTPGQLTNDFFVNVLSMDYAWAKSDDMDGVYVGRDRDSGEVLWTATPIDLAFGSNSELRAVSEAYASADGEAEFVADFIAAWVKVMNADRFDIDEEAMMASN